MRTPALSLAFLLVAGSARASGGGSSGAEFLRVGLGARPAGLGDTFTGLADDVTAAMWNPAGLGQIERIEISGMHMAWLGDTAYEYLGAALPLGGLGTLAFSGAYVNVPSFDSTGGVSTAQGAASDGMAALSFGGSMAKLVPGGDEYRGLYYGATVKYIFRSLGGWVDPATGSGASYSASAIAGDAGMLYRYSRDVTVGASLLHFGQPVTFLGDEADALPLTLRGGFAWRAFESPSFEALVVADVVKPMDADGGTFADGTWWGAGLETRILRILSLRGGYRKSADGARIVGGGGINIGMFSLDGAVTPLGDFGTGWRAGLTVKLGKVQARMASPQNVTAAALPGGKVGIRWTPVYAALGYHVEMQRPGEPGWKRITKSPKTVPELTLKGLKPGSAHRFRVIAIGRDDKQSAPVEVNFVAAAAAPAPASPAQVFARASAGGRVSLTWNAVAGVAGYHVYMKRGTGPWKKISKTLKKAPAMAIRLKAAGPIKLGVVSVDARGKKSKARTVAVVVRR